MIDVSFFVEACRWGTAVNDNSKDAGPKVIPNGPAIFVRRFVRVVLCSAYAARIFWKLAYWLNLRRISRRNTLSRSVLQCVCEQISPRGLLLKKATGYAI